MSYVAGKPVHGHTHTLFQWNGFQGLLAKGARKKKTLTLEVVSPFYHFVIYCSFEKAQGKEWLAEQVPRKSPSNRECRRTCPKGVTKSWEYKLRYNTTQQWLNFISSNWKRNIWDKRRSGKEQLFTYSPIVYPWNIPKCWLDEKILFKRNKELFRITSPNLTWSLQISIQFPMGENIYCRWQQHLTVLLTVSKQRPRNKQSWRLNSFSCFPAPIWDALFGSWS